MIGRLLATVAALATLGAGVTACTSAVEGSPTAAPPATASSHGTHPSPRTSHRSRTPSKPATHRPTTHRPTTHGPTTRRPTTHRPTTHGPATHRPTAHRSAGPSAQIVTPVTVVGTSKTQVVTFAPVRIGAKTYAFTVDTGAAVTVLDSSVATANHLASVGPPTSTTTIGCQSPAQRKRIAHWTIAGRALPAGIVVAEKIQHAGAKVGGLPYGGLLGSDVLSSFGAMRLDFAAKQLVLRPTGKPSGTRVPLIIRRGLGEVIPLVPIDIAGTRTDWIFDTGASTNNIDTATAARLHLPAAGVKRHVNAVSCTTTVQPVKLTDWSAGSLKLPSALAVSSPSRLTQISHGVIVGLFGAEMMAHYGRVTIDFAGSAAYLGR